METELTVAVIALIGVFASALVQFYLGKHSEKNKKFIEVRFQAYLDLVNSVSEIASSAKHNKSRSLEQLQNLTKSKTQVILVGSSNVVTHVHKFFMHYGTLETEESLQAFGAVVSAMRKDISNESSVSITVLNESLFGRS
jgi:hypothetical protein